MTTSLDVAAGWLADHAREARAVPGRDAVVAEWQGRDATWQLHAVDRSVQQQFLVYSVLPMPVPPDRRDAVAEYVTRANSELVVGNFELDLDDGEVRFKTYLHGEPLTPERFQRMVVLNVAMVDRYLPGLVDVVSGRRDPVDAIRVAESA